MNTINELHLFQVNYELRIKPAPGKAVTLEVYSAKIIAEFPEEAERHLYRKFGEQNVHVFEIYKLHQCHAIAFEVIQKIVESNYDEETKRRNSVEKFEEKVKNDNKQFNSRYSW